MTFTIELLEEEIRELAAKAQAHGVSAEDFARQALKRAIDEETVPEPFWKAFTSRVHGVSAEVFDHLPADGASEHDHYLYGSPKRNP